MPCMCCATGVAMWPVVSDVNIVGSPHKHSEAVYMHVQIVCYVMFATCFIINQNKSLVEDYYMFGAFCSVL